MSRDFDVCVHEPDISPLAVQGPMAEDLIASLFGEDIRQLGYFRYTHVDLFGTRQLLARSGYSRQGGFEIYLDDARLGPALWDLVWHAGETFNIAPGSPNLIERIEGGLLSYGNDMTRDNNPLECGLGRFCTVDGSVDCIGLDALQRVAETGPARQIRGVVFDGGPCPTCAAPWPVMAGGRQIGMITSAVHSPRLKQNVGLSMIDCEFWSDGQLVTVLSADGKTRTGQISHLPFR